MQRIRIEKLGPVNSFESDISQYMFLIGEQASGKSTIAKGIYFCRNYKTVLREALYDVYNTGMYKGTEIRRSADLRQLIRNEIKSQFIEFFGYSWDLDRNMILEYEFVPDDIWIRISLENRRGYINLTYSQKLSKQINLLISEVINLYHNKYITRESVNLNSKERIRVQNIIKEEINKIFLDYEETYYLPAGRSMLALLSRGDLSSMRSSLDYVTCQFLDVINSIRRYFMDGINDISEWMHVKIEDKNLGISRWIQDILKANYYNALDREYIKIKQKNGKNFDIPLNFASSGQQESLWLLNLLYVLLLRNEQGFIIIEEPEAHLYPTRQYNLIKFIAYFANETGSNVLITTHSPYCLTSLNTLYIAGTPDLNCTEQKKKEVCKILGGNFVVDKNSLKVYKMLVDGAIISLISEEEGEIRTELIDEVSQEILSDYLKISDLLLNISKEMEN